MIRDLKPYPAYRSAGISWLAEIPSHWGAPRLKAVFREVDLRSGTGMEPLLTLRMREGLVDHGEAGGRPIPAESLTHYKVTKPGELVMNRMRAATGLFGLPLKVGLVSPDYAVLRPRMPVDLRYFLDLFRTPGMMSAFRAESHGLGTGESGFLRLYTEQFGTIEAPFPPTQEQAAIVRFLDHADRRIRRYSRAKQRLVSLLEEQKRAAVHRAVIRGLDPDVALKPSGMPSIGELPAHWQVVALKRVVHPLVDCEHKTAPAVDASEYLVVRTAAVRHGRLRLQGTYCTTEDGFREWTRRGVPAPGDVVFTREAPAGEACVIPHGIQVCLGQRTVLLRVRRDMYDPSFLVHMIYGGPPADRIKLASQGSTVGHFNMDDIASMIVLAPPLSEQKAIVDHLAEATGSLDIAAQQAEREVQLLREYRTRLIADVITGKLDVRDAAAHLSEDVTESDFNESIMVFEDEEAQDLDAGEEPDDE